MAEKTRRNGRRMEKKQENKAGVIGERRGEGRKEDEGGGQEAGKCWGWGMHLPAFMSHLSKRTVPPEHLGMLWRGAVTDPACAGLLQPSDNCAWD